MKPKSSAPTSQHDLFSAQFEQILNLDHPLCVLANKIDWTRFEVAFEGLYDPTTGAPGKATRLLVALHFLKHSLNLSDESLVEHWVENPYWQYFCGYETMQHKPPLHPTSMTKWRQRVGAERLALLLEETVAIAVKDKLVTEPELSQVNIDTTVQEKNITHPTDSKLYLKAIQKLADAADRYGIVLRQSYRRVAKQAAIQVSRYAHAKQYKRMRRLLRKMRTWLGRVIRDIQRKSQNPSKKLVELLSVCERLHAQQPTDKKKLYSLHEPDVQCISKGKAHKRYEFGQKVAVATTNLSNWIVGIKLCDGNPYDGHTLATTISCTESITGVSVTRAYVDKGYQGHDYTGSAVIHRSGQSNRGVSRTERRKRKRRSAIEPKIGHLKSDNRMNRCYLKGLAGDAINAVLAAAGSNLQKLLRALSPAQIFLLLCWLIPGISPKLTRTIPAATTA